MFAKITKRSIDKELNPNFTLVELLVVIAIISLLMGMLIPALSAAKRKSLATKCAGNLSGLGTAVQVYLGDYNEVMPEVAEMPSLGLNTFPRLCDVFEPFVKTTQIFLCPSDPEGKYYTSEGCSYEYNTHLGGRKISDDMLYKELGISKTFVMYDYDNFHGKSGKPGARNYLFADGHVGDLADD